jgi:hypothetical protein
LSAAALVAALKSRWSIVALDSADEQQQLLTWLKIFFQAVRMDTLIGCELVSKSPSEKAKCGGDRYIGFRC